MQSSLPCLFQFLMDLLLLYIVFSSLQIDKKEYGKMLNQYTSKGDIAKTQCPLFPLSDTSAAPFYGGKARSLRCGQFLGFQFHESLRRLPGHKHPDQRIRRRVDLQLGRIGVNIRLEGYDYNWRFVVIE